MARLLVRGGSSRKVSAISLRLLHLLGALEHFLDRALHVESLLGDVVVLAVADFLEALDRVDQLHVLALEAGELLGHEEGLREEHLDLAGARDAEPVVLGQFVNAENGDVL